MRLNATSLAVATLVAGAVAAAGPAGAITAPPRPHAEHVPTTVHKVTITYSQAVSPSASEQKVRLHARQRHRLAHLFNRLAVEPPDTVHCMTAGAAGASPSAKRAAVPQLAGGPVTRVVFRSVHHVWIASQAACTNITVTRDGQRLPTLVPDKAWERTVSRDLGQ